MPQHLFPPVDPTNGVSARLGRNVSVRLVNVSRSGVLLECHQPIPEEATGELRMFLHGVPVRHPVHVKRVVSRMGCHRRYLLGGELSADARSRDSVCAILPMSGDPMYGNDPPAMRGWRKNGRLPGDDDDPDTGV